MEEQTATVTRSRFSCQHVHLVWGIIVSGLSIGMTLMVVFSRASPEDITGIRGTMAESTLVFYSNKHYNVGKWRTLHSLANNSYIEGGAKGKGQGHVLHAPLSQAGGEVKPSQRVPNPKEKQHRNNKRGTRDNMIDNEIVNSWWGTQGNRSRSARYGCGDVNQPLALRCQEASNMHDIDASSIDTGELLREEEWSRLGRRKAITKTRVGRQRKKDFGSGKGIPSNGGNRGGHIESSRGNVGNTPEGEGRLVFIKTFKTGSSTLAKYIVQVGGQYGYYFLHPRKYGWFEKGELEARLLNGQQFDACVRHQTPKTDYLTLSKLIPGAKFVTLLRDPFTRFLSLFNFRGDIKKEYKTPVALISAIRAGQVSKSDARPFCNQFAWMLSGKDVDYSTLVDEEEAERVAVEVIQEVEKWGVKVLITERMNESFALLVRMMEWNMASLNIKLGSLRVQSGTDGYYTCKDQYCMDAIRSCNMVDQILYNHYLSKFEVLVSTSAGIAEDADNFSSKAHSENGMSSLVSGKYPTKCIRHKGVNSKMGVLSQPYTGQVVYSRIHSCEGRPKKGSVNG